MRPRYFATLLAGLAMLANTAFAQVLQLAPGLGIDIGAGANGAVWMAGFDPRVYRWESGYWRSIIGPRPIRLDVDPQGNAWIIDMSHSIYRWSAKGWEPVPGAATDIGIGADGTVWIIGTAAAMYGYHILRWDGSAWQKMPRSAVRIDVDASGNAWIVTSRHTIARWNGSGWTDVPGSAADITIGGNEVYIVGTDHGIYRWSNGNWVKVQGQAVAISADGQGHLWAVDSSHRIHTSAPR